MSRESIAKKELDKAEYRYKMSDKYNEILEKALTKGVPITGSLKSLDEYYKLPKEVRERFDYKYFQKKYGDRIKVPHDVGNKFGTAVEAALDISKGKNLNTTLIGLIASETAGKALKIGLIMFKLSPQGFLTSLVIDIGIGIAGDKISEVIKNAYDRLMNNNNDLPEITPNGFLKVTMPDGTVYARPFMPNAQGSLFGNGKDDVLFGGSGNDMLIGYGGADLLIGGSGKDDYFVDNGDTIKDSDGKGRVFLSSTNIQLTGGTQIEKGSKIYKGKDGTKYEIDGYNLIINDNITIENFNPYADEYLGITLYEADEISVSVSDASAKEKEQSMSFDISLSRDLKEGEFVKVSIPAIGNNKAKTYMFLHGSSTDWKVGDGIEYIFDSSTTYTYSWSDDKNIEPDETISVKATIIDKPENLIAKDGKVGTGTIQDDDDDLNNPNDTFPDTDPASTKTSPIVIDLNNDGVKTISRKNNKIYFDLDNNKFAQNSAWIDKNDGILINKTLITDNNITNGSQLFGNHTLLTNGNLATNGFEALKEFANLNLLVA